LPSMIASRFVFVPQPALYSARAAGQQQAV